jgi:hypothetical protein
LRLVGQGIEDAAEQRGCTTQVQREFVFPLRCANLDFPIQKENSVSPLPPSDLTSGTSTIPDMTVGMPITSPENVELPPKYSAYLLPEETMMKNVV